MNWYLIGGPHHGETGEGEVPDSYVFERAGSDYGITYDSALREADHVYRWEEDAIYIRDGRRLLSMMQNGEIGLPADVPPAAIAMAFGSFEVTFGTLFDHPNSDEAQMARTVIDDYRANGIL